MLPRVKRRRPLMGPAILVVAIAVAVSAQYSSWWAINAIVDQNGRPVSCENYWTTVFPSSTWDTRCGGSSPPSAATAMAATAAGVPHVTAVASASANASLLAGVLAGLAVLLSVLARPGFFPRRGLAVIALALGVLAATASFAGAIYFMEALPSAWQSDHYTYQTGDPGRPSFSGHDNASFYGNDSGVTESWSWGPTTGWYLAWGSGALILAGSALTWRTLSRDGRLAPPESCTPRATPPPVPRPRATTEDGPSRSGGSGLLAIGGADRTMLPPPHGGSVPGPSDFRYTATLRSDRCSHPGGEEPSQVGGVQRTESLGTQSRKRVPFQGPGTAAARGPSWILGQLELSRELVAAVESTGTNTSISAWLR